MLEPLIISAAHPLVVRPLEPYGFTMEVAGRVIFTAPVQMEKATFRIVQAPGLQACVVVNVDWLEDEPGPFKWFTEDGGMA